MSLSIGSITAPSTDAYVNMFTRNIQADLERTEGLREAVIAAQTGECPVALMEACKAFESFFLQMMFREMRRTVPESQGVFERSNAERIFTEMLDEQVSIMAANNGGIGLAAFMFQQMQREGLVVSVPEYRQMRQEEN